MFNYVDHLTLSTLFTQPSNPKSMKKSNHPYSYYGVINNPEMPVGVFINALSMEGFFISLQFLVGLFISLQFN
jgi:hypothetical protein